MTKGEREISELLDGTDMYVKTYSPGDGVTRYRFFCANCQGENKYFGPANGLHTSLGLKEAKEFALGIMFGAHRICGKRR